jgi:hypothetical protein
MRLMQTKHAYTLVQFFKLDLVLRIYKLLIQFISTARYNYFIGFSNIVSIHAVHDQVYIQKTKKYKEFEIYDVNIMQIN